MSSRRPPEVRLVRRTTQQKRSESSIFHYGVYCSGSCQSFRQAIVAPSRNKVGAESDEIQFKTQRCSMCDWVREFVCLVIFLPVSVSVYVCLSLALSLSLCLSLSVSVSLSLC